MASTRRQLIRIKQKLAQIDSKIKSVLQRQGRDFVTTMQTKRLSGPTGPNSLSVRTGTLRRNVASEVVKLGPATQRLIVFIKAGAPYARIHEKGGTIKPVKAGALAIPLGAAKTKAGAGRGGPRDFADLVLVPRRGKNSLLVRKRKGQKGFEPMFVLVSSVEIPARLGFATTFQKQIPTIERALRKLLRATLKGN